MSDRRRPYTAKIGSDAIVVRSDGSSINFGDAIYHPENVAEAQTYATLSSPETTPAAAHYWVGDHGVADGGNVSSPETTPAGVLDEAWEAAEKALPEGWVLSFGSIFPGSVHREKPILYWAGAGPVPEDPETLLGGKDSPAAALHALAAALGRSGSGGGRG